MYGTAEEEDMDFDFFQSPDFADIFDSQMGGFMKELGKMFRMGGRSRFTNKNKKKK